MQNLMTCWEFHLLRDSIWMHGFTGRADVLNSAAVSCIMETHSVHGLCFFPSICVMLADNKASPPALGPVRSVILHYARALQQGSLNWSPRGGAWRRIKNGWPWLSYKQLWGIKQMTWSTKKNHELSFQNNYSSFSLIICMWRWVCGESPVPVIFHSLRSALMLFKC